MFPRPFYEARRKLPFLTGIVSSDGFSTHVYIQNFIHYLDRLLAHFRPLIRWVSAFLSARV